MNSLFDWVMVHPYWSIAIAAMMCGVALFYLVMARTIRHRERSAGVED